MVQSMQGFEVQGGGGTDMGQAIETIDKELRPDAILMVTDCETGWGKKPRARVVIAATEAPSEYYPTPTWATVIDLSKGGA
jgi:predicted metal-dependent peptidase